MQNTSPRGRSTPAWLRHHQPYTYYSAALGARIRHVPTIFLVNGLQHRDVNVEAFDIVHERLADHGLSPLLILMRLVAAQPHPLDADYVRSMGAEGRMKLAGFSMTAQTPDRELVTIAFIVRLDTHEPILAWCDVLPVEPAGGDRVGDASTAILCVTVYGDMQLLERPRALGSMARSFVLEDVTDGRFAVDALAQRSQGERIRYGLVRAVAAGSAAALVGAVFGFGAFFTLAHHQLPGTAPPAPPAALAAVVTTPAAAATPSVGPRDARRAVAARQAMPPKAGGDLVVLAEAPTAEGRAGPASEGVVAISAPEATQQVRAAAELDLGSEAGWRVLRLRDDMPRARYGGVGVIPAGFDPPGAQFRLRGGREFEPGGDIAAAYLRPAVAVSGPALGRVTVSVVFDPSARLRVSGPGHTDLSTGMTAVFLRLVGDPRNGLSR